LIFCKRVNVLTVCAPYYPSFLHILWRAWKLIEVQSVKTLLQPRAKHEDLNCDLIKLRGNVHMGST
jgi:hypothetical protein